MNSGFLLFIAGSIILFGISCGFSDQSDEGKKSQSDQVRLPIKFSFRANYDPGHGGSSQEFSLERTKGKFLVKFWESRYYPRPGENDFRPETASRTEERTAEETEGFLNVLVNDVKFEELKNLKARVLLHPTFYDFEIRYADGHIHRIEYVVEAGNHLDERYRRLVEECDRFFISKGH